jgi:hypothetical protein
MSRFFLSKALYPFTLSLLVSIGWMQSLWLSLPRDEHIVYPIMNAHIANTSLLVSIVLLLLSLLWSALEKKWVLFILFIPVYLSLEFGLAVGVYVANGDNHLPFDKSISGLDHHISLPVENYQYNVAHYGYLASTWYALYQCDSLGIQCDLLFETSGEENRGNRFHLDNLSLEYEASTNKISLLYGTEIMNSHAVPLPV